MIREKGVDRLMVSGRTMTYATQTWDIAKSSDVLCIGCYYLLKDWVNKTKHIEIKKLII